MSDGAVHPDAEDRGRRHAVVESTPIGPVTILADGAQIVGLYMQTYAHGADPSEYGARVECRGDGPAADPLLADAAGQLTEYFAGDRTDFDLPLRLQGTDFQQRVWRALCDIPFGATWSYGELAAHIGNPTASRAVGLANGRNPISIIVPCHRVIGADGSLTGYGGGIERKRWLLAHERGSHEVQQQLF